MHHPLDLSISHAVSGYTVDGDAASVHLARELIVGGSPPWRRSEFDPGHFTASGFVLSPDTTALLLIHHAKLDRWLQPGGHFEPSDESVADAARREITEETGLSDLRETGAGIVRVDAHPIPARGAEPAHTHIDLGVGFIAESDEVAAVEEVLDARWVPFDRLSEFDVDDAVLRGVTAVLRTTAIRQDG